MDSAAVAASVMESLVTRDWAMDSAAVAASVIE
jgi:hypothetical protein